MSEFKLYKVYYLGEQACWNLHVARSPEEALMQCFKHSSAPVDAAENSCRAEEVKFDDYEITIKKA